MFRLAVLGSAAVLALGGAACGVEEDTRPQTLEYITAAVLIPSCAAAQCHSALVAADGFDFSSAEATRRSIEVNGLVVPGDPELSTLFLVLVSPGGENQVSRMPWDRPMPNADIALIERWIASGAPGIEVTP